VTASRARSDPQLLKVYEFVELVASSVRSRRQSERLTRVAGVPITTASLGALRLVHRHGPIAVADVAQRLGVDQSTASRQLRPLDEHGLIRRKADSRDRRVAWLSSTQAGRALLDRVREVSLNDFDVALAGWSARDRRLLAELLDRFRIGLLETEADETGWSVRRTEGSRRAG
jgi:DNA-binding MarR family transcriptional regulator